MVMKRQNHNQVPLQILNSWVPIERLQKDDLVSVLLRFLSAWQHYKYGIIYASVFLLSDGFRG